MVGVEPVLGSYRNICVQSQLMFDVGQQPQLSDLHFRLSDHLVPEWGDPRLELGGVYYWGVRSTVVMIIDREENPFGFFLGIPIDYGNRTVIRDCIVYDKNDYSCGTESDSLERWLFEFGGRWLAVVAWNGIKRVYTDTNATIGLVFDTEGGVAASAASVLLSKEAYSRLLRYDLLRRLDVANAGWLMSGLTAHEGVERLLANHYLDLNSWVQRRHWPKPHSIRHSIGVEKSLQRIAAIVSEHIETLVANGRVACALTAGCETRLLLACSKGLVNSIDFITVAFSGAGNDVHIASDLAAQRELKHCVLPMRHANETQITEWFYNGGHCVGGILSREHPSVASLSSYDFFIGGLGGEVARGFFYRQSDTGEERLSGRELVARAGLPSEPTVVQATEKWLRNTPQLSAPELLDLAYVELRMGPWAFASSYANQYTTEIHPLVCRESYELIFGLPYECKRGNPLLEIIEMLDPSLLEIPINRYGSVRDQVVLLSKLMQPKRVAKKIRKLFG